MAARDFRMSRGIPMPTYEYECTSCDNLFEAIQSMSEEPIKTCPKCGMAVKRVIGGGMGIIFKGSGFYKNDSRSSAKASSKESEGASSPCASCKAKADSSCPVSSS
jgi:putative FmdB family regulatory protein